MGAMSWTPAAFVFWGGLAVMSSTWWLFVRRPELAVRLATYPAGSIGDQAERWLRSRS